MVVSFFCRYNILSSHQLYKIIPVQHIARLNGGKLVFRKHFQFVSTRWSTNGSTKIIKDKKSNFENIKRLLFLLKEEKYNMVSAIGLLIVSSGVTMSIPFAMGKVIDIIYSMDQLKTEKNLLMNQQKVEPSGLDSERQSIRHNLKKVCIVLMGVFVVGALANFGRVFLMRTISQRVSARIRSSVYSSIGTAQITSTKLKN